MKKSWKFLLVLVMWLSINNGSAQPYPSDSMKPAIGNNHKAGHFVLIRGIQLYYESYGTGEPLLMIHGNGGSINSFVNQIPYFAKQYHVIAVDSRAQGKSIDEGDSLSFEMMADDFALLLDSLNMDSCNVLGWSDGGINGLLLAIRHPDKVKQLAITGANLWADSTALFPDDYKAGLNYFAELSAKEQTPEVRYEKKLVGLDAFEPHITLEQLKQIHCPVLVLGGDHDIIPVPHTVLIAQSIPGAFLWIVPNSSHSTLFDQRKLFNQVVDGFFKNQLRRIK